MGRNRKGARKQKDKNFNRGQRGGAGYDIGPRDNELFVKYYKGQGIVPEGEWEAFYETLKKTLPVTFRITGYKSQSEELLKNIKGKFFINLLNVKVDDQEVPPPKQLTWYPNELAWQLDLSRKVVRSSEHFSRLHDFLVAETECGSISRQEAVSMIPPLVLDIQSHHKILDMCASPGSKTAQLIEYLHSSSPAGELPTGYVIANDTDNKRCYLMVHQVKRLQSPCCMIVNHDGTNFPKIRTSMDDHKPDYQMFDRVLCDVPCSGDGTMRKNFDVWSKWHPLQGANMHGLQFKLLRRGCQLLSLGGRLVYSTCSLNPAEDEAVIAEMIRSSEGAMELVDIHDLLPGLKFSKGLSSWKVMTKKGEWLESVDELPAACNNQYKKTVFPPTAEEAERFHLDRCIRILPHQQDTGGFFVAALQKVKHLPGSREARLADEAEAAGDAKQTTDAAKEEVKSEETTQEVTAEEGNTESKSDQSTEPQVGDKRKGDGNAEEPLSKKKKLFGYKEDPFFFMEPSDPVWPPVREFFGLGDNFPCNQILYRSLQGKRTLYFVSEAIRQITVCNEDRVRFINMGVKAFSRSPSPIVPDCDFRITQECLGTLLPVIKKRIVDVTKEDAIIIISQENPFISKLSIGTQNQLYAMKAGSSIFRFTPSEKEPVPNCEVVCCGWRGKNSVRCFGSRSDRSHALMLLGEDLKEINRRVEEEKKAKQMKKEAEAEEGIPSIDEEEDAEGNKVCEDGDVDDAVKDEVKEEVKGEEEGAATEMEESKSTDAVVEQPKNGDDGVDGKAS